MPRIFPSIPRLLVSEDGPRAIESAVMLTLALVGCIAIIITVGHSISGTFSARDKFIEHRKLIIAVEHVCRAGDPGRRDPCKEANDG